MVFWILWGLAAGVFINVILTIAIHSSLVAEALGLYLFFSHVFFSLIIWDNKKLSEKSIKLEKIRNFIGFFIRPESVQEMVDSSLEFGASKVDEAVQRSIQFQKGGLIALKYVSLPGDDENRTKFFNTVKDNIEKDVVVEKDHFWRLYDLVENIGMVFRVTVRKPRSYKQYLPTQTPQKVEGQ